MKKIVYAVAALAFIMLAVYLYEGSSYRNDTNNFDSQDIKQLVQEYSTGKVKNETASITSHELIVTKNNHNKITYDLPDNEFFVSIAPYVHQTHPCAIHSLTGCRGELANEEFSIYIEDTEGNKIMDQTIKSLQNGFIDLWLPRDATYRITIEHNGKTSSSEISTFKNDNTCITTMQLL